MTEQGKLLAPDVKAGDKILPRCGPGARGGNSDRRGGPPRLIAYAAVPSLANLSLPRDGVKVVAPLSAPLAQMDRAQDS